MSDGEDYVVAVVFSGSLESRNPNSGIGFSCATRCSGRVLNLRARVVP